MRASVIRGSIVFPFPPLWIYVQKRLLFNFFWLVIPAKKFCFILKLNFVFVLFHSVPPDIVDSESSGDVMVTEGQNTTLRCSATGHPLPVITWRREDGRPIQNHGIFSSCFFLSEIELFTPSSSSSICLYRLLSTVSNLIIAVTVEGSVLHLTRIPRQNIGAYLCIGNLYINYSPIPLKHKGRKESKLSKFQLFIEFLFF